MKRGPKILLGLGGLAVLGVFVAPAIAGIYLKDRVAAELARALGRPVALGGLHLDLLGGLNVGLREVSYDPSGPLSATADGIDARVALLPLLDGKVAVKSLGIVNGKAHGKKGRLPWEAEGIGLALKTRDLVLDAGTDPMALLQTASGEGTFSVATLRAKGVDLTGLSFRLSLEKGTAQVMDGKGALNTGSVELSGTANLQDPRSPDCSVKCALSNVCIPPDLLAATPASRVLFEGQISDLSLDLKGRGLGLSDLLATASGTLRLKAIAKAIDFSSLIPGGLVSSDLVTFTGLEAAIDVGNGICDETVLLSAPDNGLRLTGTTRLSDRECDYTVQPTGKLSQLTGGRAIYLIGPIERLRPNSAKMMEKEARRVLEEELKERALEGLQKLLP